VSESEGTDRINALADYIIDAYSLSLSALQSICFAVIQAPCSLQLLMTLSSSFIRFIESFRTFADKMKDTMNKEGSQNMMIEFSKSTEFTPKTNRKK
jgi:hypothetical protein